MNARCLCLGLLGVVFLSGCVTPSKPMRARYPERTTRTVVQEDGEVLLLVAEAEALLQQQNYQGALAKIQEAQSRDARFARLTATRQRAEAEIARIQQVTSLVERGKQSFKEQKYTVGCELLTEALKLDPAHLEARHLAGAFCGDFRPPDRPSSAPSVSPVPAAGAESKKDEPKPRLYRITIEIKYAEMSDLPKLEKQIGQMPSIKQVVSRTHDGVAALLVVDSTYTAGELHGALASKPELGIEVLRFTDDRVFARAKRGVY